MYAVITLTVLTESGARYILRQHGGRLYVTRLSEDNRFPLVNQVTTDSVGLISEGVPMHITFPHGAFVRTTPVVAVSYRVDRYLTA